MERHRVTGEANGISWDLRQRAQRQHADGLQELVARGELDGAPIGRGTILLQADVQGIYSAFSDGPLGAAAFLAQCARIFTLRVPVDLAGFPCLDDGPFYRGEGRLVNLPHWQCRDLDELGAWFRQD